MARAEGAVTYQGQPLDQGLCYIARPCAFQKTRKEDVDLAVRRYKQIGG